VCWKTKSLVEWKRDVQGPLLWRTKSSEWHNGAFKRYCGPLSTFGSRSGAAKEEAAQSYRGCLTPVPMFKLAMACPNGCWISVHYWVDAVHCIDQQNTPVIGVCSCLWVLFDPGASIHRGDISLRRRATCVRRCFETNEKRVLRWTSSSSSEKRQQLCFLHAS